MKNLPAMQQTWVQSLGQEDPLEEGMAAHSSILAWRIPWTEEPGWLQSIRCKESDTTEATEHTCMHISYIFKNSVYIYKINIIYIYICSLFFMKSNNCSELLALVQK